MAVIDKAMYEKLKKWSDGEYKDKNENVLYVKSRDRVLTDATLRKLMFDLDEEDEFGDVFMYLFSAKNFYKNMREYYSHILNLYVRKPNDNDSVIDIINRYPSTCGWIVLIVEDIEELSMDDEAMREMLETIKAFAAKRARIIFAGKGDYDDVFKDFEDEIDGERNVIEEKKNWIRIGYYNQEANPNCEDVVYETPEKMKYSLLFYWRILYKQLKNNYFDYEAFKALFKDTLEYIIPRVTKDMVYRKDLRLIERIGLMSREKHEAIEGCDQWEFDAAKKMTVGLNEAIINTFNENDDISTGIISIEVEIEEKVEDCGCVIIFGSFGETLDVDIDNACSMIDRVSKSILEITYKGDSMTGIKYLYDEEF